MKVLLIRPPLILRNPYSLQQISTGVPIGMLYVAAALEGAGHQVSVLDGVVEFDVESKHAQFQRILNEEYMDSEDLFGTPWTDIRATIAELKPDLVGISNQFTDHLEEALTTARIVKGVDPNITVIVGGPHATVAPQDFFQADDRAVDAVCLGEGDVSVLQIVERVKEGDLWDVEGVAFVSDGKMVCNQRSAYFQDLDELSLPAYHLVDMEKYFRMERMGYRCRTSSRTRYSTRCVSLITSRGCPHRCIFCSIHLHMGRRWRHHSPQQVLSHIKLLVDTYGVEHIAFEDDNLSLSLPRFEAILDGIVEQELGITWDTPNGVRSDRLTEDILVKCKGSGCSSLIIGVESGSQRVLDDVINKDLDLHQVVEIASICREIALELGAFFMIGFPGETKKDIETTIDFALMLAHEHEVRPFLALARPLLGTRLHRVCEEKGYLTSALSAKDHRGMLEQGISDRTMIETEEFNVDYLSATFARFRKKLHGLYLRRALAYVLMNPRTWISMLSVGCIATLKVTRGELGRRGFVSAMRNELKQHHPKRWEPTPATGS